MPGLLLAIRKVRNLPFPEHSSGCPSSTSNGLAGARYCPLWEHLLYRTPGVTIDNLSSCVWTYF